MPLTKTLQEREKELQSLLADAAGKQQLQELASRYHAVSGKPATAAHFGHHLHPGPRTRARLDCPLTDDV